jgi:phosphoserine phosphatase
MKFKLVAFDVDGTLTVGGLWPRLHKHMCVPEQINKGNLEKFKNGQLVYEDWVKHDIMLFKELGANKSKLMDGLKDFELIEGGLELIQELKKAGYKLAIVSGTLNIVLEKIFPDYEKYFDYTFFNHILFDENGEIIGHEVTPYDNEGKAEALKLIAEKEGLDLSECVFIGDNFNDVEIAKAAGLSIAFNCKSEALAEVADVVVMGHDMRNLLDYIHEN